MKVYFVGSYSESSKSDITTYLKIIDLIKKSKHKITNPYFEKILLEKKRVSDDKMNDYLKNNVYKLLTSKIEISDCVIAEISVPSVSLGIQIEYALNHKIPVLCLIHNGGDDSLPLIIRDYKNTLLLKSYYTSRNITEKLEDFFSNFPKSRIKFNMFINYELDKYLSFLSKKEKTPKSEIIRKIISAKMSKDTSFDSNK